MCELSKLTIESATPSGQIATIAGIDVILCTLVLDHEINGGQSGDRRSVLSWRIFESDERRVPLGEGRVCGGQLHKGNTDNKVSLASGDLIQYVT